MTRDLRVDICVIGAGSGGLTMAAGASQMGAETALIEGGKMGGDCLNYGCVPSKSLLAAARAAEGMRRGGRFGVDGAEPAVDFARVHDHVHDVIARIAPNDSVERFEGLGVKVIREYARFSGPRRVEAGDVAVSARRFVIATGSRPRIPPIPGLGSVSYLTNETIFDLTELPEHLLVMGGGPIGMEMAQAHRRLGARVTVLERLRILPRDDPELVDFVRRRLTAEGVDRFEGIEIDRVERAGRGVAVFAVKDGAERRIEGTHLLIAVGRRPNVDGLDLEAAGIAYGEKGIAVDGRLRTSNKRVFAIGDVIGGYLFTHMAGYHAGVVIRNALFRLPAKVDYRAVPWVTYTEPELAHVGMGEKQAREAMGDIRVLRWPFSDNDRAQTERDTDGMVKAIATRKGRVVGASIVGHHAGELLLPWSLAIDRRIPLGKIAGLIAPYPTLSEASKRAAVGFYTDKLFSARTRKLVRFLSRFG